MLPDRVIECRGEGYLTRQLVLAAFRDLDEILAREPGRFDFLSDGLEVDGFDAGIPIALIRWASARADRYVSSAIVVRNHTLYAVARTFAYLLPTIPVAVFRTREEAFEYLASPPSRVPPTAESIVATRRGKRASLRAPALR